MITDARPGKESTMDFRATTRCLSAAIVLATFTLYLGVVALSTQPALGAAPASITGAACLANTLNATVRFSVGAGPQSDVTALALNRFNTQSCEGATVQVDLRGNSSGDPSRPASELLSTLDSTKSACTGVELPTAVTIHDGAVDLMTCDAASQVTAPGPPADLHDLTLLVIKIAGAETSISVGSGGDGKCTSIQDRSSCVLGEKVTRTLRATGNSRGDDSSDLPFTGAWAALALGLGALGLLVGILLTVLTRRRTSEV